MEKPTQSGCRPDRRAAQDKHGTTPWTPGHASRTACPARKAGPWTTAPASETRRCPARHAWIRAARRLLGSCAIAVGTRTYSPAPPAAIQPCRAPAPQTSWPPPGRLRATGRDKRAPSMPSHPGGRHARSSCPHPPHKDCGRAPLRTAYSSANLPPGIPTMARQIQYRKRQAPANAQQTRGRRPVRLAAPSVPRGEKRNRASRPPPRTPSDLSIHSAMRQQDAAPRPDSRPSLPGEGETSEGEERTTGAGSEGHFFHRRPMACSMISRATSTASGFGTIFTTTGGLQQVKRLPIVSSKAWVAFSIR